MKGELPDALVGLSKLRLLDLGGNALSGSLPAAWGAVGAFPDMATVNLADNQLSGATTPPPPPVLAFSRLALTRRPFPARSAAQKSARPQVLQLLCHVSSQPPAFDFPSSCLLSPLDLPPQHCGRHS